MSLEIEVGNAVNLPNLEKLGKIDPYVKITIQGITKKTAVVKSELNPAWNEKLVFDFKGQAIREQDELVILVNDWERVGSNRLVGKYSLFMKDVLRSGFGQQKLSLSLCDGNKRPLEALLNITILYKPPPGSELNTQPAGREIATSQDEGQAEGQEETDGGDISQPDGVGPRKAGTTARKGPGPSKARESLSTKPQDFQLRVKVIEARQLPGSNISPVCRINCHNQTKQTSVQKSSNAPCWNEIFFFNFFVSPAELFDKPIIFGVYNSRKIRTDSFIGSFKFDIGLVYDEPRHSFVNKWLLLCDPEDTMAGHKGYLKICATLLGPGDDAPTFLPQKLGDIEDDIESNLLRPAGIILRPATLKLKLYHAEDIPRMDSNFLQGVKRVFSSEDRKELVDPYFVFSFAGREVKSKTIYNCDSPEWNQELRLAIRFPSMCESIKFQMYDWDALNKNDIISSAIINKTLISDIRPDGFLPMFGPSFINFYGSPREYSELPTEYEELNFAKGEGVAYRGRALVELQTIIGEVPLTPSEDILAEDILRVQKFMRRRKYKLHTAFMSASMISTIDAPIEFEVSIGNYGNKLDESLPPCVCTTQPTNAVFDGSFYYFLPWGDSKPCVVIDSHWEDISFRLEALNFLIGITDRLEANIANVRLAQKGNMPLPDLAQCLISLLDSLILDCRKPLPDVVAGVHMQNDLDIQMRQFRISEMSYIVDEAGKLRETATDIDDALNEVETYLATLKNLSVEPQNSIPDVIIWMISGEKRIAYYRCPAHLLLWSPNPDYRGKYCGKRETISLRYPGGKAERENRWEIPALLRLKIWFGLEKQESEWHKMQTEGELAVFAETYENQASIVGKWKAAVSRPEWSDVTGKLLKGLYEDQVAVIRPEFGDTDKFTIKKGIDLRKDDFKPPTGWRWDGDWYVNPEISLAYEKDTGHSRFMEDVYECQSRLPGTNWNPSSNPWTDVKGDATVARKDIELPVGWEWEDDWQVDLNRAVDEYGWEYTLEPTLGAYGPVEKNYHLCRRRRWVRMRHLMAKVRFMGAEQACKQALSTEGWEYAPLFSMKFHHKERKMDLARRRRWHRKMVPEEEKKKTEASSGPCFFSFATKLEESTKDKKDDEELKKAVTAAPRMFLVCKKPFQYQMRAYVYQGRDLLAGDSSGLSDPFARIIFMNQSQATEKEDKTLCPTWDQTLIFETVDIYGDPRLLVESPPQIVIEVFDHDAFGAAEFLGRARATPLVKLDPASTQQPMLQWYEVTKGNQSAGELLLAFELFLMTDGKELPFQPPRNPKNSRTFMVPNGIRPQMTRTAIEVMCWGVRNMKRFQLANVSSPSVEFEVGGQVVQSKVIRNTSRNPNFDDPILFFDIMMPKEELYAPPLNIRVRDNRQFGRKPLIGVFVVKSLESFRCNPQSLDAEEEEIMSIPNASDLRAARGVDHVVDMGVDDKSPLGLGRQLRARIGRALDVGFGGKPVELLEEDIDWWSKYYASTGELDKCKQYLELGYDKIKVYPSELEKVPEFKEFSDFCHTFNLVRGKNIEDEESNQIGEFKGTFRVYQLPGDPNAPLPPRILKDLPQTGPVECIVRVYVVKATELQPKDPSGLADPYVLIKAGKTKVHNRNEYVPNTLNPVFGRMFEIKATLPIEKDLYVRVKDYDVVGSDDTVGETVIDLENRFLSQHRAVVGLPKTYCTAGVCAWRDTLKPTEILERFCAKHLRSGPVYSDNNSVKISGKTYTLAEFETKKPVHSNLGAPKERLALHVLNVLPLSMGIPFVPEHVETRPLFNPLQPGIEQGRLEMWVDVFPVPIGPPGPPVDVKSRKPKKFELRVIIWNTRDVILDETSITGEKMSDIYVKGWVRGIDEKQETDVHYRSLDGEGNFNWRFVFPLEYIPAEQCLVVKKKEHFWKLDETERRLPPVVTFQVWDNDKFNPDDFLGALEVNLESMPQPVRMSEKCSLDQLPNFQRAGGSDVKMVSLFEQKRLKGFWPLYDEVGGVRQLTGKVEMELELVSETEATARPVGRARDEPNQHPKLDPPNRPDTSFLWFTSPWKTCKFIVWRRFRWYFIGAIILILIIIFLILFFYAIPGTAVKKMFGA